MARKLIIDTDPGVDDAMAILTAFNSEEVDVIGITSIFGNVQTATGTLNAILLRELAGREDIPVAEGAHGPLEGVGKLRVADFVHGSDGLGNSNLPAAKGKALEITAAQFIVDSATKHPGQVTVLALGPLTNVALALKLDSELAANLEELVILGGAFFLNGNVNPAAEANMFGDPTAADFVFSCPAKIRLVGLDVTHRCQITAEQLCQLEGTSKFGSFVAKVSSFYVTYHQRAYNMDGVYVHDPTALAAVIDPSLFTWRSGEVRVVCDGLAKGISILDAGLKNWSGPNAWSGRPKVSVALEVKSSQVCKMVLERLSR